MTAGGETKRDLAVVVAPVLFMALWSAFCAMLVDHACFDIEPVVAEPLPGTPRAGYCGAVGETRWLTLTVGPTLLMGVIGWVWQRHPRRVLVAMIILSLLLIANAVVANTLTYSGPGP